MNGPFLCDLCVSSTLSISWISSGHPFPAFLISLVDTKAATIIIDSFDGASINFDVSESRNSNLRNFGRFCGEDPERVVPESAGEDEPAVDRHDEAVAPHLDTLAEVVAQVSLHLKGKSKN